MTRAPILSLVLCLTLTAALPVRAQVVEAETLFNAGLMHLREGRVELAVEQFRRATKVDPKNPYAWKGLGISYMRMGDYPHAVEAFKKALEVNPYYVDVRNDLGTALVLMGKRAEGKAEFVTALNEATNPTPEVSARNLGQAYFEEKNYGEAANWYQSSIGRNKEYSDAYLGLGDSLLALGRVEEAIRHMETGVKETQGNPCVVSALGEAKVKAGRFTEARMHFEDAVKKDVSGPCGRRATDQLKTLPR
jgi:Flp pilus assembly protein TadD